MGQAKVANKVKGFKRAKQGTLGKNHGMKSII